jgi:hypothetical protein
MIAGGANGTRNARSVWTVATQPYSGAHFATFPPKLIEPCVMAGSAKQACEHCGAAWRRVVERVGGGPSTVAERQLREMPQKPYHGGGKWESNGSVRVGTPVRETLGFEPSCSCESNTGSARSVVLDPFGGAGTTGLVADRLGRDAILVELNPEYAAMARNRIHADNPLFTDVA